LALEKNPIRFLGLAVPDSAGLLKNLFPGNLFLIDDVLNSTHLTVS
jgi:hypothetical protein